MSIFDGVNEKRLSESNFSYEIKEEDKWTVYVKDENDKVITKFTGDSYNDAVAKRDTFDAMAKKKVAKRILKAVFYVSVAGTEKSQSYLELRFDIPILLKHYRRLQESNQMELLIQKLATEYMASTKVNGNNMKDIYLEFFSNRQYHFKNFRPKNTIGYELEQFRETKSLNIDINSKIVFGASEYSSRQDTILMDNYVFNFMDDEDTTIEDVI